MVTLYHNTPLLLSYSPFYSNRFPSIVIVPSNIRVGERHGDPLQYSYLENFMDRGAWRATWGQSMELQRVGHDGTTNTNGIVFRLIALYFQNSTSTVTVLLYCSRPLCNNSPP